jgi:L-fucose mutarotase/ribose pyranase (RbsD/FucU family)
MPEQNTLLMIFTGVLAFAVLVQTLLFWGIYRYVRQIRAWTDSAGKDLPRKIKDVSSRFEESLAALKDMGEGLKPITSKLADTTDIVHRRVVDLDAFLAEATNAARLEILRLQETVQSAAQRADVILEQLQSSILAPINEISAVTRAIRAGFSVLFRGRKNVSDNSAHDEEMFI